MVNPFLADTIERAARDPIRKLGWDDRLIGTIRLGREEGIPMPSYAMGAAAALAELDPAVMTIGPSAVERLLRSCWPDGADLRESQSSSISSSKVFVTSADGSSLGSTATRSARTGPTM
jgi:hypothetical protein